MYYVGVDIAKNSHVASIMDNDGVVHLEALEFEKTKVLIFGKSVSRKGRRMGVVLSSNSDINLARKNADEAARKIKVSPK